MPAAVPPGPRPRPRRTVLADLLREAIRLDRTQSDPIVSLRNAIGVAAPLAVGQLSGNITLGLAATVGALQTALADRPGPYRLRIVRMLGTAVAAGITSGLAVLASRSDTAAVLLLLVLAFIAGLMLAGGPSATQVGVASVAAALVLGHLRESPSAAWHIALLVLAGGALQTLLAVAAWPLGRHRPERLALARLYRELAGAARVPAGTKAGPPAADALAAARGTLYGLGHDHGPSVEAYRVLLDEAERIRREVVVVIGFAERLASVGDPILAGLVRESVSACAGALDAVADSLEHARPIDDTVLEQARLTIDYALARLANHPPGRDDLTRRAAASRLRALAGQLRAAVQSTKAGASEGRTGDLADGSDSVRDRIAVLRANLTPDSVVVRHAIRVAVLVAGTDLVVRLADIERGYWVSLTVLVVLRPDFGATLQRAVLRTVGTIVGLLAATVLLHWVPLGDWWQIALVMVFAFAMRLAGPGNVALSAVSLSGLVVVLLELDGVTARETLVSRSVATLVGGALAVLAVLALPTWERSLVRQRLAELLAAYRNYVLVVEDPDSDLATLQEARSAGRVARTNAQASVDRARAEPVHGHAEIELGRMVLAHSHRLVHAIITVDAVRKPVRDAGGLRELRTFLEAAADALTVAHDAVVNAARPAQARRLRPLQQELASALETRPTSAGGAGNAATLTDATDRITNSLDTLVDSLRVHYTLGGVPARDPVSSR